MSKRSISIKKKILYPVLLGLVTLSSTAMATIEPGLYNGTTKHYRKGKERNSPVLGAAGFATGLVENIRFFGPFTPAYKEDGTRDYAGDTSDNPSWQMVKILFPSTGGSFSSQANFETNFGNNVDKVQTIPVLLGFVNDLREGKDVNVEALKNALFSTLKERPPYDSRKEQADLGEVKNKVKAIQASTKADFIKALRGLGIDPNLKKEMIGYATNKYKPKNKPNDLDAGRLEELKGLLIGVADQWISTTIQKKQRQEDERFKQRFFRETLTPLIESIQQAVENEKDSIFPAYTTEQLIETFFSHKFNTEKDINNLIEATPDDIVDPAVPFVSEPASAEEILKHEVLDMDDFLALFALGMAGAPVPYQLGLSPITNGENAWFYNRATDQFNKAIGFADCVDEMPRHMANMLLYDRGTQAFNVAPLLDQQKKFEEGSPQFKRLHNAIEFFTKYQSPMMANNGATDTRSWWNRVIADLNFDGIGPKVDYVKRDNELDTGHINMLRMFQNLFSLELDPFPVLEVVNEADLEKEKEALLQILQKLGLKSDPFPALKVQEEATPEQEQEAQAKLAKDILSWKAKARESIQKKFEEDRISWILKSFHKVFSFMNTEFAYDFKPQNLSWSFARNDVMGDITVLVKKSKTSSTPLYSFRMHQKDGHSEVKDIAYTQNQAALEIETKPAAIEPLTAEESLWLLFPQLVKTKITEPLYQMMPRLLADNDSKIAFISMLKTMDWQSTPSLARQEIAGFLSNILPTLGWDDPDTLRRITSSIVAVFLDETGKLNETVPQEIGTAFFKKTQALNLQEAIKPNFARVLPYFQNDMLKSQDSKIKFIASLSGIDWAEVPEHNASEITGLLSRTLDSLSLDTQISKMSFLQGLKGLDWKELSEENAAGITGLLSNMLDTLRWDDFGITSSILGVLLDETGKLKEALPSEIREAIFSKTQSLEFAGFQGALKPNFMKILFKFKNDVLKTQNSKVSLLEVLSSLDWEKLSSEDISRIERLVSTALDTFLWDDRATLQEVTNSIVGVFLDETGKLNEAIPPEIQEAIFSKTQSLELEGAIKPNFMQLLLEFKNNVLKTQKSKMSFLQGLSGIDWKEVSEENTSKIERLLSTTLDTLSWDGLVTDSIVGVFLDKDGRLKDVPQKIKDVFFHKTQTLIFEKEIFDSFVHVLPHFKNNVLRRLDQTLFLESLSRIDWKGVSEENVQELAGLLTKVLSPQIPSPGNASVRMPHMPPKRVIPIVGALKALPQRNTTAIVNVFLDKDGRFKYVPEKIQEAFFTRTQSLVFQEAIKPNFARMLPYFQKDMLTTPDLKIKFVDSLRDMAWKEVSEGEILGIAGLLSKVLNTDSAVLASSIVNVLLDKTGALNALLPREIQETFFNKTRSLGFSGAITSDVFLGLSKILPRFVQAKDTITQLTISGGEGKIEEFPESLDSLTLSKVKVGTVALATLPSLNNLSFEDVTLDRLVIDPAHSQLKMTVKSLRVPEIQGLENLEVFQKGTLSSQDPFFNEITGLEAIKFTNPNHKIETLSFEDDTPYGKRKVHPSRIEGLNNLPHLHVLDLSSSQVASIEGFESLAQLKKVRLAGSLLGMHRFSEKHQTLEELSIRDLGDLPEIPWVEHLTQLKKLGFSGASLGTLRFFPSNASLEEIEIKVSEIGEVQGLEHLTQLKKLAFTADETGTYASVLDSLTFSASNAKLEELSVARSYVNSLQGLGHLKGLRKLDLTQTGNLTALNFEDELPNLRIILAGENPHIEEINGLDKLPNLVSLVLPDTKSLKALRFTGSNEHLKDIYMPNSGVTILEGLDTLPNLEMLTADGARNLRSVRLSSVNAKLKDINLSQTRLISIEGLEKLPALKTLKLGTVSTGPKKLTLPEDVKFTQWWGAERRGENIEIIRVKRPTAVTTHEEND
jgi:Leucine-rich repeat (LRR) protein